MSYNNENKMYEGYIYKITNKVNGKCYIGQTIQSIEKRYNQHIKSSMLNNNNSMALPKAIRKYGIENFEVCELYKVQTESQQELSSELNRLEIDAIKEFKSMITENGYNISIGGNNVTQQSKTMVDKYSIDGILIDTYESAIDACRKNSIKDDGYRNILSCCAGKKRIAYGYIWRYSGEHFDKYRTKKAIRENIPIDVYDLNGNLLCSFDDIYDPIGVLDGIVNKQEICECCKGAKSCYKRYVFRYKGESFNKYNLQINYKNMIVYCYDLHNNYIQEFENATVATMYLKSKNIDALRKNISRCAIGNRKTAYGFKWYYEYNRPELDLKEAS